MKVMMTFRSKTAPTLKDLCEKFGLSLRDLDIQFGVIEIDPSDGTYAMMVEQSAAEQVSQFSDWKPEGPFANPPIAPFGPPEA